MTEDERSRFNFAVECVEAMLASHPRQANELMQHVTGKLTSSGLALVRHLSKALGCTLSEGQDMAMKAFGEVGFKRAIEAARLDMVSPSMCLEKVKVP